MGQNVFWNVWPVVLWLENDANISQKQPVITDTGACLHATPPSQGQMVSIHPTVYWWTLFHNLEHRKSNHSAKAVQTLIL